MIVWLIFCLTAAGDGETGWTTLFEEGEAGLVELADGVFGAHALGGLEDDGAVLQGVGLSITAEVEVAVGIEGEFGSYHRTVLHFVAHCDGAGVADPRADDEVLEGGWINGFVAVATGCEAEDGYEGYDEV